MNNILNVIKKILITMLIPLAKAVKPYLRAYFSEKVIPALTVEINKIKKAEKNVAELIKNKIMSHIDKI